MTRVAIQPSETSFTYFSYPRDTLYDKRMGSNLLLINSARKLPTDPYRPPFQPPPFRGVSGLRRHRPSQRASRTMLPPSRSPAPPPNPILYPVSGNDLHGNARAWLGGGTSQARLPTRNNAIRTIAPTVAMTRFPRRPVACRPNRSKRKPPSNAPMTPTMRSPISPKPPPFMI